MESVVVVTVADGEVAHTAMRELCRLHGERALWVQAATVVQGAAHGVVRLVDGTPEKNLRDSAAGSTVADLLDALKGPVGSCIGGATATIVRSLLDIAEPEESGTVVAIANRSFPPRKAAIVAVVAEATPRPLDDLAADVGAALVRQPRAEVERDLADAVDVVTTEGRRGG